MSVARDIVIVGGSLAGAAAAETLRAEGFDGRIVLLGEEPELPYERPPLSKAFLAGDIPREQVYLHEDRFYAERTITVRTNTRVAEVDRAAAQVVTTTGDRMRFDRLLLATGAAPRRVQVPGSDLDGVTYLRNLADADALRKRLDAGGHLVVVGAGWIGTEVAATARQRGLNVTMIDPMPVPLARVLGPEVGEVFRRLHAQHGVQLLPTALDRFDGDGRVQLVVTSDGHRLDADAVVIGAGVHPRTQLAERAGLCVDNGIVVDELLTTRDPRIFAAGDVARARHPLYRELVRVEHWDTARQQGAAAARSMLGRGTPYDRLPYFFSDQYELGVEYRGRALDWDTVIFRGDPDSGQFLAFWVRNSHVLAGMNVNSWDVGDDIHRLVRSRAQVDPERLADPAVPLPEVATQPVAPARTSRRAVAGAPTAARTSSCAGEDW